MRTRLGIILLLLAVLAVPLFAVDSGASVARGAASETHEEVAGEDHGGEAHETQTYLGIPAWVLKLLNLILFIGLLWWLLAGPIGKGLAARREKIRADLAQAAERRQKADRLAADIQERLDSIEKEVGSILRRAEEEGERQKSEMIAAAEAEAAKLLATARSAVDAQLKAARQELTEYAGQLASERALSILETQMTDADRKKAFAEGLENVNTESRS